MKCDKKIWVEDVGDGYSDSKVCNGEMIELGKFITNDCIINKNNRAIELEKILYQCESCKTIQLL